MRPGDAADAAHADGQRLGDAVVLVAVRSDAVGQFLGMWAWASGTSGTAPTATRDTHILAQALDHALDEKRKEGPGMNMRAGGGGGQGCIRREGASEAIRQAVRGGCQSGWGRLLSVTHAMEAGTWR